MDFPYAALPVTEAGSIDALLSANAEALEHKYAELYQAHIARLAQRECAVNCGCALQVVRQLIAFMETGSTVIASPEAPESR